jgi:dipeptidyl-peptidase-3
VCTHHFNSHHALLAFFLFAARAPASWHGALICLEQTSTESPALFGLFQRLFSCQSVDALRASAVGGGDGAVSAVDFERFLRFAASFYGNMGNYLSFGDTKLVPNLPAATFRAIVAASSAQGALKAELVAMYALARWSMHFGTFIWV